jgi:hypothetical protein
VKVRPACRLLNLLLRAIRPAEGDVGANRIVEEHRILGDDRNRLTQGRKREGRNRHAIQQDSAGVRFEETHQQSY